METDDWQRREATFLQAMGPIKTTTGVIDAMKKCTHIFACNRQCRNHGPKCNRIKTHFLSKRNSIRTTYAYMFLLLITGSAKNITDKMVQATRKLLHPRCEFGILYVRHTTD